MAGEEPPFDEPDEERPPRRERRAPRRRPRRNRREPDLRRAEAVFAGEEDDYGHIFGGEEMLEGGEPVAFEDDRPRHVEPPPPRRRRAGETARRIIVAIPWIVFAIAITVLGGLVFAVAMIGIGVIALREWFGMTRSRTPMQLAAFVSVIAMIIAAHFGTAYNVLLVGTASFPLLFVFAVTARPGSGIVNSMGITVLGTVWIGLPLVHAVLLRDLPFHGAALLIDVLVGTFVTDTGAYACGRAFGQHKLAPRLSPNKTIEGLLGGFVIGTMGFWFAGLYQDWLSGTDALIMGAAVAALAPLGDLFQSMMKRDLSIKDTGTIFGPHGGLLDRLDAVFFTIVAGYYLSVLLVY